MLLKFKTGRDTRREKSRYIAKYLSRNGKHYPNVDELTNVSLKAKRDVPNMTPLSIYLVEKKKKHNNSVCRPIQEPELNYYYPTTKSKVYSKEDRYSYYILVVPLQDTDMCMRGAGVLRNCKGGRDGGTAGGGCKDLSCS